MEDCLAPPTTKCRKGQRRCPNGSCVAATACCPEETKCSDDSCIADGTCCPGQRKCSDDSCVDVGTCCPDQTKCPGDSCVPTGTCCPGEIKCSNDAIARALLHIAAEEQQDLEGHDFVAKNVAIDDDGSVLHDSPKVHVRFDRSYKGIPIIGGDFIVHMDESGGLHHITRSLAVTTDMMPNVTNYNITSIQAKNAAKRKHGGVSIGNPALVMYAQDDGRMVLAWNTSLFGYSEDGTPTNAHALVDAYSGVVVASILSATPTLMYSGFPGNPLLSVPPASSNTTNGTRERLLKLPTTRKPTKVPTRKPTTTPTTKPIKVRTQAPTNEPTSGIGNSLYLGQVTDLGTSRASATSFLLKDPSRGNLFTKDLKNSNNAMKTGTLYVDADNTWGNGLKSETQSAAVDAHYGMQASWDYFKNVHGRKGVSGDGIGIYSSMHFGFDYNNAYWEGGFRKRVVYGDGNGFLFNPLVSLDIVGHEISHGVTEFSANLIYANESGALNEATSDIFGTMIEFYANSNIDKGDYLIGEKVMLPFPGFLRSMSQPSIDGQSVDCYFDSLRLFDPHYSSGVANHFFFLLAEGTSSAFGTSKTCTSTDVSVATGTDVILIGIGKDKAAKIWYRALTTYMTSKTTYGGARAATLHAAFDLYGLFPPELMAVADAWTAVNVVDPLTVACEFISVPDVAECRSTVKFDSFIDAGDRTTGSTIPSEIGLLTQLMVLRLPFNQLISTIPTEIALLTNLVSLDFSVNQLTSTIPSEIGLLSKLTNLLFSYNQLTSTIPSQIERLTKLEYLGFFDNQLSGTIPSSICSLAPIIALWIDCGGITCDPACCISGEYPNPPCS